MTYETIGQGDNLTLKPLTYTVEGTAPAGFNADTSGLADPSLSTVVTAFDGSGFALVPPGQVPPTIEGLSFSDTFPGVGDGRYNFTAANTDGTITALVFPTEPTGGPQQFTIERADGCTTFTGGAESLFGVAASPGAKAVDGGYQLCGGPDAVGGLSLFLLAGGTIELPPVSVVQSGGKWYVSPLGTALASASTALHDAKDGSSLFDSPLGPFFYGGFSREWLELTITGQGVDTIGPECLPALTVDNGIVTGVVADPPPDAVRSCASNSGFGGQVTTSESGSDIAVPVQAPPPIVAEVPSAETTPATTAP